MKKSLLFIAVAVAMSATFAAEVRWTVGETFADSQGVAFSESRDINAYLFDVASVSQNDLFKSWIGGAADVSGAAYSETWYNAYQVNVTSSIGETGTKSLYWAVINGDELFVSSVVEKPISGMGVTEFLWTDESGNVYAGAKEFGSAGWYTTGSVPEPTSGLLLLLGMAGLGLRRRRA